MAFSRVVVLHGGELAVDVAEKLQQSKPAALEGVVEVTLRSMDSKPKELPALATSGGKSKSTTLLVMVIQTVENAQPTEEGGATLPQYLG